MVRASAFVTSFVFLFVTGCSSDNADPAGAGGGAGMNGSAGSAAMPPVTDFPTDTSAEGIAAFLDALDYKSASWASSTDGPRVPASSLGSPHGLVQIWYNRALRESQAAGHTGTATDASSMVVKEFFTDTNVVGHAAMLKTTDTSWLYYCSSSETSRCYTGHPASMTVYQTSISNCGCHGAGTIITRANIPPP